MNHFSYQRDSDLIFSGFSMSLLPEGMYMYKNRIFVRSFRKKITPRHSQSARRRSDGVAPLDRCSWESGDVLNINPIGQAARGRDERTHVTPSTAARLGANAREGYNLRPPDCQMRLFMKFTKVNIGTKLAVLTKYLLIIYKTRMMS